MASQQVDNYSIATPADADQAIGIEASDTTDSANGTVKRYLFSAIKSYVLNALTLAWSSITGTPTTLAGYGISDAAGLTTANTFSEHQAIGADAAPNSGAPLSGNTYSTVLTVAERMTDLSGDVAAGAAVHIQLDPSGAVNADAVGLDVWVESKSSNAADYISINGINALAVHRGAGAVDSMTGLTFTARNSGAGDVGSMAGASLGLDNSGAGAVASGTTLTLAEPNGAYGSTTALRILGHDTAIVADAGAEFGGDVTAPNLVTTETAIAYAMIFG